MRGTLRALVFAAGAAAAGCHHDKHNIQPPVVEEYVLPTNEARYNLPDTANYRRPVPRKEEKTMLGRDQRPVPGGPGGF